MTARPTIAMFGSSLVSAYWNGAATYYRGMLRALHERGYDIVFYESDAYNRQQHRDIEDPPWARVVVYPATAAGVERAVTAARHADILVKASGCGAFDEELEAAIPAVRRPGHLAIFWDVDAPATLERMRLNARDAFHRQVSRYDLVLTYGGGDPVVNEYQQRGARACVPIYNALDPTTHFAVPADSRFTGDLAFLGNRLPDREARVRDFFLEPAKLLPAQQFVLGGSGWDSNIELAANVRCIGHVYTRDHNAFNCSARAVININRDSMAKTGFSPPTRVFEAAGAGACLLCDHWEGIELFLEPGTEVLPVHDGHDVVSTMSTLDAERARRIGAAAQRRVLAHHTYTQRAEQLTALLNMTITPSAGATHPQELPHARLDVA
jgi:spore maturation protein CgeB